MKERNVYLDNLFQISQRCILVSKFLGSFIDALFLFLSCDFIQISVEHARWNFSKKYLFWQKASSYSFDWILNARLFIPLNGYLVITWREEEVLIADTMNR